MTLSPNTLSELRALYGEQAAAIESTRLAVLAACDAYEARAPDEDASAEFDTLTTLSARHDALTRTLGLLVTRALLDADRPTRAR